MLDGSDGATPVQHDLGCAVNAADTTAPVIIIIVISSSSIIIIIIIIIIAVIVVIVIITLRMLPLANACTALNSLKARM